MNTEIIAWELEMEGYKSLATAIRDNDADAIEELALCKNSKRAAINFSMIKYARKYGIEEKPRDCYNNITYYYLLQDMIVEEKNLDKHNCWKLAILPCGKFIVGLYLSANMADRVRGLYVTNKTYDTIKEAKIALCVDAILFFKEYKGKWLTYYEQMRDELTRAKPVQLALF